jgi:hypothetical protein
MPGVCFQGARFSGSGLRLGLRKAQGQCLAHVASASNSIRSVPQHIAYVKSFFKFYFYHKKPTNSAFLCILKEHTQYIGIFLEQLDKFLTQYIVSFNPGK